AAGRRRRRAGDREGARDADLPGDQLAARSARPAGRARAGRGRGRREARGDERRAQRRRARVPGARDRAGPPRVDDEGAGAEHADVAGDRAPHRSMSRLVLLHTNDLHGNVEALARVATLVERIRAESDCPVVYVDAGDAEETTTWISNVTRGTAMHRLLSAAGCEAAAVGNASWLRYGPQVLPAHAEEASYPLLLANVRAPDGSLFGGTCESTLVGSLGLVGVTA